MKTPNKVAAAAERLRFECETTQAPDCGLAKDIMTLVEFAESSAQADMREVQQLRQKVKSLTVALSEMTEHHANFGVRQERDEALKQLAAERERVTHILTLKMNEYMMEVQQLREQVAAERNNARIARQDCNEMEKQIKSLEHRLGHEQQSHGIVEWNQLEANRQLREQLAAERERRKL